jgi:hypothetical protein
VLKRQVSNAFRHFACIVGLPPAFFPKPFDLVVVAPQINSRVDNREE